ncbi:MAG: hypothetical protein GXP25_15030 [Planctomycetes bacterium]|nr:hypothetical protein [Planctomycetota bacterium]
MNRHRTASSTAIAFLVSLGIFVSSLGASADTVVMKNGNRFKGKVLEETPKKIVLQMQFGTMTFERTKIKEIKKDATYKVPPPPKKAKPKPEPQTDPVAQKKNRPTAPPKTGPGGPGCGTVVFNSIPLKMLTCVAKLSDNYIEVIFFPFEIPPEREKDAAGAAMWTAKQNLSKYPKAFPNHPFVTVSIDFKKPRVVSRDNIKRVLLMLYGFERRNQTTNITIKPSKDNITRFDDREVHIELKGDAGEYRYDLKGQAKVYRDE